MTAAAAVIALGVLLVMAFVTGRALFALARAPELHGLELAFGLSLLALVAVLGVRLPGAGVTAAVLLVAFTVAAAVIARRERSLPPLGVLVAGGLALLAAGLPFAAQGRFGILGVGVLEDISAHYALADSLRDGFTLPLTGDLSSYPVAPHALAAGLMSLLGTDDPAVFTALMMSTAAASAMAAATALRRAPAALTALGGLAAGFGFLPAAYYGQSAFKETFVTMLVLAFAVALDRLAEEQAWRGRAVAALGVPAAAALGAFGAPGPAWLVGTAGLFLVATAVAARHRPQRAQLRRVIVLGAGAVAVVIVLSLPQIDRLVTFNAAANAVGGTDPKQFFGNLVSFLPLREALGIWPGGDYRLPPSEWSTRTVGFVAVALALGLAAALINDVRHRRFALGAALLTALAIYAVNERTQGPYVTAKTMVVMAPLAATMLFRWLFAIRAGALRVAGWSAGVVVAVLMLWSTSLALRSSPVGPLNQALSLRTLAPAIGDRDVLFIGFDNFAAWELGPTQVASVSGYAVDPSFPVQVRPNKPVGRFAPLDADTVTPATLARTTLAVTSGAGYASRLAGDWTPIRQSGLYTLWQRKGAVPDKRILDDEATNPGGKLVCKRGVPSIGENARVLVLPDPVGGPANGWRTLSDAPATLDGGGAASVPAGATVTQTLDLAPGDWDVSLQYTANVDIRVSAPFLDRSMPANLASSGTMWPVGTLRSDGSPTSIYVTVGDKPLLSRGAGAALGPIVATRRGGSTTMTAGAACGRFIDGYLTR